MQANPVGREILATKPRINENTLDLAGMRALPAGTLGRAYADWMGERAFSPDERTPVRLVDDVELAYVMTRYREVHDFWHVLLGPLPTSVLAELAVKWVETVQLGLPMRYTTANALLSLTHARVTHAKCHACAVCLRLFFKITTSLLIMNFSSVH